MKHKRKEQIKAYNDVIAIATIKDFIKKDDIKKAIDICEKRNFTAEEFGEIVKYIDKPAEEIQKLVFKY